MLLKKENTLARGFDLIREALMDASGNPGHPFRLMTLATQDIKHPGLRQVILRQATHSLQLYFYTDIRTAKISHINKHPGVTVLLFDPDNKVQLVIQAEARCHHQDTVARDHWEGVDQGARKLYGTLKAPGSTIHHPDEAFGFPDKIDDTNFCVVRLITQSLEIYQIGQSRNLRARFLPQDGQWNGSWLVP